MEDAIENVHEVNRKQSTRSHEKLRLATVNQDQSRQDAFAEVTKAHLQRIAKTSKRGRTQQGNRVRNTADQAKTVDQK